MDKTDHGLIVELQKDPRKSNIELARLLGTSESTVRRRIKKLVSSGTIVLTAVPDPFKVGYEVSAFIVLDVNPGKIESVAQQLAEFPQVHFLCICTGSMDMVIWVLFHNTRELSEFIIKELGRIPGIQQVETLLHLRYPKRTLGWIQLENEASRE